MEIVGPTSMQASLYLSFMFASIMLKCLMHPPSGWPGVPMRKKNSQQPPKNNKHALYIVITTTIMTINNDFFNDFYDDDNDDDNAWYSWR